VTTAEEGAWRAIAPCSVVIDAVDVSGVQMFTVSAGEGPTPVVLISGLGDATLVWAPVLPALASACRVVAYDRPGMGASPPKNGTRTLGEMADELVGLTQNLHGGPAILVGHSLGGLIAMEAYRRHPEHVAGLLLIDPTDPALLTRRFLMAVQRTLTRLPALLTRVRVWPQVARSMARSEAAAAVESPEVRREVADAVFENLVSTTARRTSIEELAGVLGDAADLIDRSASLDVGVPLTVLSATRGGLGKKARAAWTDSQRHLSTTSASGRHLDVDGGHYLHREQPATVVREVLRLVAGVRET
jgi:pimeloyl-ACP methyl ester carboxylesterase